MENKEILPFYYNKSNCLSYLKCPYQFYLMTIKKCFGGNQYTERGKYVHAVVEKFFDIIDIDKITNPEQDFLDIIKTVKKYEEYQPFFDNFIKLEVERWNDTPKELYKPISLEKKFYTKICNGVIDRVDNEGIWDYKTGYISKPSVARDHIFELSFYAHLWNHNNPSNIIRNVGIICLKNGKKYSIPITPEDEEKVLQVVNKIKTLVEQEVFTKPDPCPDYGCLVKDTCWKIHNKQKGIYYD